VPASALAGACRHFLNIAVSAQQVLGQVLKRSESARGRCWDRITGQQKSLHFGISVRPMTGWGHSQPNQAALPFGALHVRFTPDCVAKLELLLG
jgi:hypothetical protein